MTGKHFRNLLKKKEYFKNPIKKKKEKEKRIFTGSFFQDNFANFFLSFWCLTLSAQRHGRKFGKI
jgi:hypothetical protein